MGHKTTYGWKFDRYMIKTHACTPISTCKTSQPSKQVYSHKPLMYCRASSLLEGFSLIMPS